MKKDESHSKLKKIIKNIIIIVFLTIFLIIIGITIHALYQYGYFDNMQEVDDNDEKIEQLLKDLDSKEYVLASEFFGFNFDRGYILSDNYASGDAISEYYNLNLQISEVEERGHDGVKRIVFVDKNGKFLYLFRYTGNSYLYNAGKIIYPDTKIVKAKDEKNNEVINFDSDEYYDTDYKTDYLFELEDVNNLITDYLQNKADISNVAYNYVDEENKKVVVGLVDANEEKQNKFIYDVFTHCCGSDYIRFLKEHKIIEFRESKDVFDGQVIDVKGNRITVEVLEDCKSFKKSDKVTVKLTKSESNIYKVGNNIRVIFNGNVEYSNPPQIGAVRIEIIK